VSKHFRAGMYAVMLRCRAAVANCLKCKAKLQTSLSYLNYTHYRRRGLVCMRLCCAIARQLQTACNV